MLSAHPLNAVVRLRSVSRCLGSLAHVYRYLPVCLGPCSGLYLGPPSPGEGTKAPKTWPIPFLVAAGANS